MAPDRQAENQIFTNPLTGKVINPRLTGLVGQALPLASRLKTLVMTSPLVGYAGERLGALRYGSGNFVSRLVSHAGATLSHAGRLSGMMSGYLTSGGQQTRSSPMWQPVLDLTWFQRQERQKQEQVYRRATDTSPEFPLSDGEALEDAPYRGDLFQAQPGSAEDIYHDYPEARYEIPSEKATGELLPYNNTDDSLLTDNRDSSIPPVTPSARPLTDQTMPRRDPISLLPKTPPVKTPELSRGSRIQKSDSGEVSGAEDRPMGISHHQESPLYRRLDQGRLTGAQRIVPDRVSMLKPAGDIDLRVTGNQITQPTPQPYPAEIQTSGEPYLPVSRQETTTDVAGITGVFTGGERQAAVSETNIPPVLPGEESNLPVYQAHEGITTRLRKVIERVRQSVTPKRDESPAEQPRTPPLADEVPAPGITDRPAYQAAAEVRESGSPTPLQLSLHRAATQETGTVPDSVDSEGMVSEPSTGVISQPSDTYQGKGWLMRRVETYLPRLRSLAPVDLTIRRPLRPSSASIQKSDTGGSLPVDVGQHYQSLPTSGRREHLPPSPEEPRSEPLDSLYHADAERERWSPVIDSSGQYPANESPLEPPDSVSYGDDEIGRRPPVSKPAYRSSIVDDIVYRPPGVSPGRYLKSVDDVPDDVSEPKKLSYSPRMEELLLPSSRHPVQRQPETQPDLTSREFEDAGSLSREGVLSDVIQGSGYYGSREVPELALAPAGRQAETTSSVQSETRQASGESISEEATPEIDDIARDVYRILRRRLIRERERALGIS